MTIFAVKPIFTTLATCLVLTACGGSASSLSSANPFNWFGGKDRAAEASTEAQKPADPRHLMPQVVDLQSEPASGGIILRATGLPPVQGWSRGELVAMNAGQAVEGVLSYEFRALPPTDFQTQSTPQSREVIVATFLNNGQLAGVRNIRVLGAQASLSVRP